MERRKRMKRETKGESRVDKRERKREGERERERERDSLSYLLTHSQEEKKGESSTSLQPHPKKKTRYLTRCVLGSTLTSMTIFKWR